MKKYFAIMGIALVMLGGLIGYVIGTETHNDTPIESYAKAYLATIYGDDDDVRYNVEIADLKDGRVYFYWGRNQGSLGGYASITSPDQTNWNG